jgi:hypothetical protein
VPGVQFTQPFGAPRGDDPTTVNAETFAIAGFADLQIVVAIAAYQWRIADDLGRDVGAEGAAAEAQGRASISLISSSDGWKRPASDSMIGLAI